MNFHFRVIRPAKDFHDAPFGRAATDRVRDNLGHHLLSVFCLAARLGRNGDNHIQARLFRNNDGTASGFLVAAHNASSSTLADSQDASVHLAATHATPFGSYFNNIAVHGAFHLPLRDKNVLAATFGSDKAIAVPVGLQFSTDTLDRCCQCIAVAFEADYLTISCHIFQHAFQLVFDMTATEVA